MRFPLPLLVSLLVLACDKKETGQTATLGSTSVKPPEALTTVTAAVTASVTPKTEPAKGEAASYAGDYKTTAGSLYVPDTEAFKGFKFRGDKTDDGLGAGTLSLKTGPGGAVEGEGEGALGKFTLRGFLRDGLLTANILRAKADEDGYTGTLLAEEKDGSLVGTMKLSLARTGNALREATVTLKKK